MTVQEFVELFDREDRFVAAQSGDHHMLAVMLFAVVNESSIFRRCFSQHRNKSPFVREEQLWGCNLRQRAA